MNSKRLIIVFELVVMLALADSLSAQMPAAATGKPFGTPHSSAIAQPITDNRSPLYLQVGIISMEGTPWDLEGNFGRMEGYVREAARRRAQLVIAPEAILDGYVCGAVPDVTKERMMSIAQTVPDGAYLVRAAKLCQELGIYLVFGFLEKRGDELFNSCALFDPQGNILANYRKVNPANAAFIMPGQELKTFDTPFGRIGLLICSDRHTVENFATLGVQGAQIIFLPLDGGGGSKNTSILSQRARDNSCAIVMANTWSAAIIDWTGDVALEKYETECVSVGRINLGSMPAVDNRAQFFERRPELYGPLTASSPDGRYFDENGPTEREKKRRADWNAKLHEYEMKLPHNAKSADSPNRLPNSHEN